MLLFTVYWQYIPYSPQCKHNEIKYILSEELIKAEMHLMHQIKSDFFLSHQFTTCHQFNQNVWKTW